MYKEPGKDGRSGGDNGLATKAALELRDRDVEAQPRLRKDNRQRHQQGSTNTLIHDKRKSVTRKEKIIFRPLVCAYKITK